MNECEIPIITLLILITYIGHLFAFKFGLLTLIAVLTVSACVF